MRARLVVFPIKGRIWCFSRSIDQSASQFTPTNSPSTVKDLWKKISSNSKPLNANAELLVDFISDKMNNAWVGLEKAPEGSFKNNIHGFGLQLLARVKPSEILLKSISKDVTNVRITYASSLNARLVRRRLRQVALRGTVIHRKYFYRSDTLLPLTTALAVLPLPNIPFFWVLFHTYSHWRALQGFGSILPPSPTFSLLKVIHVKNCRSMKTLLPHWLLPNLQNLEEIYVKLCEQLIQVLGAPTSEDDAILIKFTLTNLKRLILLSLPKLDSICSKRGVMVCDSLQLIRVKRCFNMKRIPQFVPLVGNGQPYAYAPPSLQIESETQWWEWLEWDDPNFKNVLQSRFINRYGP